MAPVSLELRIEREMALATAKVGAAASNLSNLNTPGYRTREVSFSDVLQQHSAGALPLEGTNPQHMTSVNPSALAVTRPEHMASLDQAQTVEVDGLPARRDGNNVQLDRELLALKGAAGQFKRAAVVYQWMERMEQYALKEGR